MKGGVTTVRLSALDWITRLSAASKKSVYVGIPIEKEKPRSAESEGGPPPAITNAELGFIQEFGAPEMNIPPRPFLVPGVAAARSKTTTIMANGMRLEAEGESGALVQSLEAAGQVAVQSVQAKITKGPFQALAPRTLQARKAKGFKGTKPLIESGQLRRAITFVVRDK